MKDFAQQLYPLGFIAQICFSLRFLIQWLSSEKKKESHVTALFWKISLIGNILLALHSYIQGQYAILLIQLFQAFISIRNIDLLKKNLIPSKIIIWISCCYCCAIPLLIFSPRFLCMPSPLQRDLTLSFGMYLFGTIGLLLFASRFWIQWLSTELLKKSHFPLLFWWMSLLGALICSFYFILLKDPVNFFGTFFAMVPYARNLMLRKKNSFSPTMSSSFFLVACEPSGDQLGKELIEKLKKRYPSSTYLGVGGEKMQKAGQLAFLPSSEFEVMGFTELFGSLLRLYKNFHKILDEIIKTNPQVIILIDYAEFNMLLAKKLRKLGYCGKIVHYVVPSVWAWRSSRIQTLAKTHDLLLSILPFEKQYFSHTSLKVSYVGHPLLKKIEKHSFSPNFYETFSLDKNRPLLALFPGSRKHEIDYNLSDHLFAAKNYLKKHPQAQVVLCYASDVLKARIQKQLDLPITYIPQSYKYELMQNASFALATCGTIVLELAVFEVPTLVLYKIPLMNYLLGRFLFRIKLRLFSLPNIIQKKEFFPEIVSFSLDRQKILEKMERVLQEKEEIQKECLQLKAVFTGPFEDPASAISQLLSVKSL